VEEKQNFPLMKLNKVPCHDPKERTTAWEKGRETVKQEVPKILMQ